jgi:hypothetical protein
MYFLEIQRRQSSTKIAVYGKGTGPDMQDTHAKQMQVKREPREAPLALVARRS